MKSSGKDTRKCKFTYPHISCHLFQGHFFFKMFCNIGDRLINDIIALHTALFL